MTEYEKALQRRRELYESLVVGNTATYQRELWQLTMLYALHFKGDKTPTHDDVIELLMKEEFAFLLLSATNVLHLWQVSRNYLKEAAGGIARQMPKDCTPDTITVSAAKTAIVTKLRDLMDATTDGRKLLSIWLQATMFEALRVEDIQISWLEWQEPPTAMTA